MTNGFFYAQGWAVCRKETGYRFDDAQEWAVCRKEAGADSTMPKDGRYVERRQEPIRRCPRMDGMSKGGRSRFDDAQGWAVCRKETGYRFDDAQGWAVCRKEVWMPILRCLIFVQR